MFKTMRFTTRTAATALSTGLVLGLLPAAAWAVGPNPATTVGSTAGSAAITTIKVPGQARAEVVDPDTNTDYVTYENSSGTPDGVAVISLASDSMTATIPLDLRPLYVIAADPATGLVYVLGGMVGEESIAVIDEATDAVTQTITIPAGLRAYAMALDPSRDLLYLEQVTGVTVIDAATGAVTATVTGTGGEDPTGIAVNPVTDTVYAAYRGLNPQVAVIDGATDTVTALLVNGAPGVSPVDPVGIAVDPNTDTFYTANSFESVSEYNGATNALISTANVGGLPLSFAVNPDLGTLYVPVSIQVNNISLVDGGATGVLGTLPLTYFSQPAVDPDTDTLVADSAVSDEVDVVALQSPAITSGDAATCIVGIPGACFTTQATGTPAPVFTETGKLPPGMTLSSAGLLGDGGGGLGSGGVYHFTITASNGVAPAATQAFTLTMNETPEIISAAKVTFSTGTSGTFSARADSYPAATFAETGELPKGVTLNSAGVLSGVPGPGTGGAYHFTITASNSIPSKATQAFTLTVDQGPAITSAAKAKFKHGKRGSFTVRTSGYPAATLTRTGHMPRGLYFTAQRNGTATITGTPAKGDTGHTYVIVVTARNGVGRTATQRLSLVV